MSGALSGRDRARAGLWAFQSRLRGASERFGFDEAAGLAFVEAGGRRHHFHPPGRGGRYRSGAEAWGRRLGKTYLLDRVDLPERGARIIDVGANNGDFALALGWKGVGEAEVLAFEPSPREHAAMAMNYRARFGDAAVRAERLALWSEPREAMTFFLASDTADSSLIEFEGWAERIEVPVSTLAEQMGDGDWDLMKVEAEGAEPEVLAGAGDALDRVRWIVVDAGPERGLSQEATLPAVVNHLVPRGFDMVDLRGGRLIALFRRRGV